jgi:hypothetical protein
MPKLEPPSKTAVEGVSEATVIGAPGTIRPLRMPSTYSRMRMTPWDSTPIRVRANELAGHVLRVRPRAAGCGQDRRAERLDGRGGKNRHQAKPSRRSQREDPTRSSRSPGRAHRPGQRRPVPRLGRGGLRQRRRCDGRRRRCCTCSRSTHRRSRSSPRRRPGRSGPSRSGRRGRPVPNDPRLTSR